MNNNQRAWNFLEDIYQMELSHDENLVKTGEDDCLLVKEAYCLEGYFHRLENQARQQTRRETIADCLEELKSCWGDQVNCEALCSYGIEALQQLANKDLNSDGGVDSDTHITSPSHHNPRSDDGARSKEGSRWHRAANPKDSGPSLQEFKEQLKEDSRERYKVPWEKGADDE